MKVIYVAGRYRADSDEGLYQNIQHARTEARKLWMKGWAVICMHTANAFMSGNEGDLVFLEGDLEILRRCDAIYMLDGSSLSLGAIDEAVLARELGLEIYYECEGVPNAPDN